MGKKRHRSGYTSAGLNRNVSKSTLKSISRDVSSLDKEEYKYDAWLKGKNPWIVVAGDTSKERFKKVKANTLWGSPNRNSNSNLNRDKQGDSEWA